MKCHQTTSERHSRSPLSNSRHAITRLFEPEQRLWNQGKEVEWHVSRTLSRPSMLLATVMGAVSRRDIPQPTACSPTKLFGCARLTLEMRLVHSLLQKEPLLTLSNLGDQTDAVRHFTRTRRTALKDVSLNMVLLSYEMRSLEVYLASICFFPLPYSWFDVFQRPGRDLV